MDFERSIKLLKKFHAKSLCVGARLELWLGGKAFSQQKPLKFESHFEVIYQCAHFLFKSQKYGLDWKPSALDIKQCLHGAPFYCVQISNYIYKFLPCLTSAHQFQVFAVTVKLSNCWVRHTWVENSWLLLLRQHGFRPISFCLLMALLNSRTLTVINPYSSCAYFAICHTNAPRICVEFQNKIMLTFCHVVNTINVI